MAGRNKFNNLTDKMSPERKARIRKSAQDDLADMLLSQIRKMVGLTQEQLASKMGVTQPTLSQLESQDDMQISTLRRLVASLGGELEIVATLPSGRITLSQFEKGRVA